MALIDYSEKTSQRPEGAGRHTNVVVAILAFNEGPTIGSVVLKAWQFAGEVVVVDDGLTDDTAETATPAGAALYVPPELRIPFQERMPRPEAAR